VLNISRARRRVNSVRCLILLLPKDLYSPLRIAYLSALMSFRPLRFEIALFKTWMEYNCYCIGRSFIVFAIVLIKLILTVIKRNFGYLSRGNNDLVFRNRRLGVYSSITLHFGLLNMIDKQLY